MACPARLHTCRPSHVLDNLILHGNLTNCHSGCLSLQVTTTLDKLAMRERFVNAQCEHLIGGYQVAREHLAQLQQQYAAKQDAAAETENKLAQVTRVRRRVCWLWVCP